MCTNIHFLFNNHTIISHFSTTNAKLPVLLKNRQPYLVTWGRKHRECSNFPYGANAQLTQIQAGNWDKFLPKPVKIPAQSFTLLDIAGKPQQFNLCNGQYIQGLLCRQKRNCNVYIVTLDTNPEETYFPYWPRIIISPNEITAKSYKKR